MSTDTETPGQPDEINVADTHTITPAEQAALNAQTKDGDGFAGESAGEFAVTPDPEPAPEPVATTSAAAQEPAAQVAPAQVWPTPMEVPAAPKDFDAGFAALDQQYEDGDLDDAAYNKAYRALSVEQARYEGQAAAIKAHNDSIQVQQQAASAATFDQAAAAWTKANAEFMGNPIRARAMQDAINMLDTQTGRSLDPTELLQQAGQIAMDAYGWTTKAPSAPTPAPVAQRVAGRMPNMAAVPRTLGDAPTAGVDTPASSFAHLDGADTLALEAAVARMSPADQEKWLQEFDSPLM